MFGGSGSSAAPFAFGAGTSAGALFSTTRLPGSSGSSAAPFAFGAGTSAGAPLSTTAATARLAEASDIIAAATEGDVGRIADLLAVDPSRVNLRDV